MPVGDSITVGIGDGNNGGYRGPLYQTLLNAGYAIDFVGSQTSGTIPDPQHEGHSGWRADQIRDNITNWLTAHPAEIILLHIGTNDISLGEYAPGITGEIGQILDRIDAYESAHSTSITVVLARIINRSNPLSTQGIETGTLNDSIQAMAANRILAGDRLLVVDHESALSYPGDLVDVVHPNASGYGKMATVWFNVLADLLCNKGDFVGDTIPATMRRGQSYECSITMKNSGCQWACQPLGTRLTVGQQNGPAAHELIPAPFYTIYTDPCVIDPGQTCTFPFTVTVPEDAPRGEYDIHWQMRDDDEWFDGVGHDAVFHKWVTVTTIKSDVDDDGDVDLDDFGRLQVCLTGSGLPSTSPECQYAKLDGDNDIDAQDVFILRGCMSGSTIPADLECGP